jgi:peptidoglycan/LPS O-acetylase OafA/YrhL
MIQRIQSVWLLLAALVMITIFFLPIYLLNGRPESMQNDYIGMILAALSVILSIYTIFRFKNRKAQLSFVWLNILLTIGLLAWILVRINNMIGTGGYRLGAFVPVAVLILLFMARSGIRKDDKLLKSLDRLR